jgi:hypothetical protein
VHGLPAARRMRTSCDAWRQGAIVSAGRMAAAHQAPAQSPPKAAQGPSKRARR